MRLLVFGYPHLKLIARPTWPRSVDYETVEQAVIHRYGRNAKHWAKRGSAFGGKLAALAFGVLNVPTWSQSALLPVELDQASFGHECAK